MTRPMNIRRGEVKRVLLFIIALGIAQPAGLFGQEVASGVLVGDLIGFVPEPPGDDIARAEGTVLYEREVYRYSAASRPDPFRSLLLEGLGVRVEDLAVRGILYDPEAMNSVAVLSQAGSDRRIQLRVGQRLGAVRILSILPDRVEVVVEELGVSKRETLKLARPQTGATP